MKKKLNNQFCAYIQKQSLYCLDLQMRSRKICQQLETIIETSLSPKRAPPLQTRILCSPNISLPSIKNLNTSPEALRNQHYKIKMENRDLWKQSLLNEIQKKKMILNSPLQAWQTRQSPANNYFRLDQAKQKTQSIMDNLIVNLCRICLKFATKSVSNHAILTIVMLHAKGQHKKAMLKIIQWLMSWIRSLFVMFSAIANNKAANI